MKKIFFLLLLSVIGATAFSQQIDSVKAVAHKQNAAAWACPTCFKITKEGGVCEHDKTAKVQLGTYYCQHCMKASGDKPGQCSMCKGATTQMTRKFCAQHRDAKKAA